VRLIGRARRNCIIDFAAAGGASANLSTTAEFQFRAKEVTIFCSAYEEIIAASAHPVKPRVPITIAELIARKIVAIGHTDERDRTRIVERVFEEIGIQNPAKRRSEGR
jgi:hypothetical protein